jgi:hypothetical protein
VPNHAPILLGAMYIMGDQQQNGPQIGIAHLLAVRWPRVYRI